MKNNDFAVISGDAHRENEKNRYMSTIWLFSTYSFESFYVD